MTDGRAVAAIDVGGTTIKTAIVGPGGVELGERVLTGREAGPDAVLDRLIATAQSLVKRCEELDRDPVGLGVAVLGIVDERQGVGRYSAAAGWRDAPIRSRLEQVVPCPVAIGHDVRAGGLAEATFGAATGARSALFVPIGTGLAAALIVDGIPMTGASFQFGELGQTRVIEPPTGAAGASREVNLESVCSAPAIAERYRRASGREPAGPGEVIELAAAGDPVADAVWSETVELLGAALAATVAIVDPAVVVIGGGLSHAGAVITDPLAAEIAKQLSWRSPPPVVAAHFGASAGVVGAAILGWTLAAGLDVTALRAVLGSKQWTTTS